MNALPLALVLAASLGLAGCAAHKPAPVVDRSARTPSQASKPGAPAPQPAAQSAAEGFYAVKRGDTLYSIALEHGADYRELAQWNSLDDPAKIRVGQQLRVRPPEDRAVEIGRPRIFGRVEGRPLESAPLAGAHPPPAASGAKTVDEPRAEAAALQFIWPARGKVIAGFAEPRNKGIDIDGKLGDPVVAAAAGRVTYIGSGIPGLGKLVVIKHDNGFITVYAHNRDIVVKEQQSVARGQKIAELGNTDADRPKLHFQIRKGAAAVDPMRYLPTL
jgi:lipoprotein NlpD